VWDDTGDYGWVSSIPVGDKAWVSDLYVHEAFRGMGYGRALMSALLREDKEHRVRESVLLASVAGARLYPHLGYQRIGTLQIFCPRSRGQN
jgi:GNAT superfamily N-acetyltransferase